MQDLSAHINIYDQTVEPTERDPNGLNITNDVDGVNYARSHFGYENIQIQSNFANEPFSSETWQIDGFVHENGCFASNKYRLDMLLADNLSVNDVAKFEHINYEISTDVQYFESRLHTNPININEY